MNKRIAMSAFSILTTLALTGGAAFAVFTSTATNDVNSFGAGNLLLSINTGINSDSSPVFLLSGKGPGFTETQVLTLKNEGSVNAGLVTLTSLDTTGALSDVLDLELYLDVNGDGILDGGDTPLGSAPLSAAAWDGLSLGFGLNAGQAKKVLAKLTFNSGAGNSYQNTSATFGFTFTASQ